ncbi:Clp protease N-terminal domain-containing protein, partial [Oceanospirillum sp. HFRX-1_2]
MRVDRLTGKLQQALADAQSMAVGHDHNLLQPVHLILAMLEQRDGAIRPLITQAGGDFNKLRNELREQFESLPVISNNDGQIMMSPDLGGILNLADKESQQRKDSYISSELVLLAAAQDKGDTGKLIRGCGLTKDSLS